MSIVGGLDIHWKQLTFDWVDEPNGTWERGRIAPADREHLAGWLTRFDPATGGPVAFAMEGCTGWRYIAEEMAEAGVVAHLAEPADTSALRGPKRRAKTDKADAKLLRELLAAGRLPECYIPPPQVLEWRALLELYQDLRMQHTVWAQRIQAVCFHQGATAPGQARIVRGDRARLRAIVGEQLSICGRLQVNTALALMDTLAEHLERLRRRLLCTARGVQGARALMHDIYGAGPMCSLALCAWLGGENASRRRARRSGLSAWTSPCTPPTADAAPAGCPGKAPRCCAGCCSKPRKPPPEPAHTATATTPQSKTATTRTAPACPRPAGSSGTPPTSSPRSATTRSPSSPSRPHPPPSPAD
jgi:transposase